MPSLPPTVTWAALAVGVLALVVGMAALRRAAFAATRWRELLQDADGANLERLLLAHADERARLEGRVAGLEKQAEELEARLRRAKRHLGLVRYDAFDDVGGEQSFALALHDDVGDGMLLTSLVGRTDCRVYAKPLVGGRSERKLSQEEERALAEARREGARPVISTGAGSA